MNEETKKREYSQGIYIFLVLAVLTIGEFVIALNLANPAVPLFIIALLKAGLIINYFMHVYRLWREESHS